VTLHNKLISAEFITEAVVKRYGYYRGRIAALESTQRRRGSLVTTATELGYSFDLICSMLLGRQ
jgi:hypothetical protein